MVFSRRAAENAEESYAYNSIGNLLSSTVGTSTNAYAANGLNQYSAISNLCGSAPLRLLQYDADGNLVSDGWNLIEERIARADGTAATNRYVWGKDL